ncbi:MAG: helix-turn-helix domain-containing protein [Firmicutes bacterium]|nr:helix-turn-helix domain-containing protein [Bacillota bacterium]
MDYILFCKRFFEATGVPVTLQYQGRAIYTSLGEQLGYEPEEVRPQYPQERNPEFSSISSDLEYGHVHVEGTDYHLYIGPLFTVPLNDALIQAYFSEFSIAPEYREPLTELLYALPISSHHQSIRYLAFLHLCLNQKEMEVEDLYREERGSRLDRNRRQMDLQIHAKEDEVQHNSYQFEQQLYRYIAQGDTDRLRAFLDHTREFPPEGKMAFTPLRREKNNFISLVSKVALLSAVPAGVDVEKAYQLVDLYAQECERLQTLREVRQLQYVMLMDFCKRCGEARLPEGISLDIRKACDFIDRHTNALLSVADVARAVGFSESYLMHRFRQETGSSVGAFITAAKLEEAKNLLRFSERSLAEISAYLGYSSQSYFQKIFKQHFGLTPGQFRRKETADE